MVEDEKTCSLCNEEAETAEHIIWRCKHLDDKRKEADSILASINCEQLPVAVRHGIAPAMKKDGKNSTECLEARETAWVREIWKEREGEINAQGLRDNLPRSAG